MSFLSSLMNALPGAVAQGLAWGIMAIGVYITFRILDVADLTVDGSLATGGAVCVMLIRAGVNPWLAMLCALVSGMLAGLITGLFHTRCGIPAILAGILTQLALYSINLRIMGGKANQAVSVDKYDLLRGIKEGGTFLLNCMWNDGDLEKHLPASLRRTIARKKIRFYTLNAVDIAMGLGLGGRINMLMQAAFFKLAGIIPLDDAVAYLNEAIVKTYGRKGHAVVDMN